MKKLAYTRNFLILILFFITFIRGDNVETKEEIGTSAPYEPAKDHDAKSKIIINLQHSLQLSLLNGKDSCLIMSQTMYT
jgi:hypothetical protein